MCVCVCVGNNYYGVRVRDKVREIRESSEREAYILMDRIRPPPQVSQFVFVCMYVLLFVVCVSMCVHLFLCVCVCVCVYRWACS